MCVWSLEAFEAYEDPWWEARREGEREREREKKAEESEWYHVIYDLPMCRSVSKHAQIRLVVHMLMITVMTLT